jgi:glycosyltransferase involved in cell wall biosynthesis
MKIVFLCGSLELGHDGVGDYTRRLAIELIRQGHNASVVALSDQYLAQKFKGKQYFEDVNLQVLRIPSKWSVKERFSIAKDWIDEFDPEWISLQYVIFSFAPSGLPFFINKYLKKLSNGRYLHIMFHEIWVGIDKTHLFKSFIKYVLQRVIIRQMIKLLRPTVIHTHLPLYQIKLESLGLQVSNLPLFSNIDVNAICQNSNENNVLRIGFFSQAEISESIAAFLENLGKQANFYRLKLEVILIGGTEAQMKKVEEQVEMLHGYRNKVKYTGYLNPKELSKVLHSCTLGMTPVPRHALGKSGSVAAFIAHGIPIAAPNVHPGYIPTMIGFFSKELISTILLEPDYQKLQELKMKLIRVKDGIQLSSIAHKFISDLKQ